LVQATNMGCIDQVVVVDDASDPPVIADDIRPAALPADKLVLLRQDVSLGPGPARNRALDHVETSHLIYVDADDLLTRELLDLWSDLTTYDQNNSEREFDLCLFKYADSRMSENGGYGQMPYDEKIWRSSGVAVGALCPLSRDQAATLAQIGNYPWNKIYRTEFLRESGARCSDTRVHEDIALHWHSLIKARHILTSDRVVLTHFVAPKGSRLTNLRGAERLLVFGPLAEISASLHASENAAFRIPYLQFCTDLLGWISDNIDPDLLASLYRQSAEFLTSLQTLEGLENISQSAPRLANRIDHIINTANELNIDVPHKGQP